MHRMWDAQNNHRDYRVERKIWFGMTGLKNPIRRARARRSPEGRPLSIEGPK